jgi:hypothetical protein
MTPWGGDPHYVFEQYEALRREARTAVRGGHGLTLFLTRGMPAWLAALTALAPRPAMAAGDRATGPPDAGPCLASGVRTELIAVLAGMVLGCAGEERG